MGERIDAHVHLVDFVQNGPGAGAFLTAMNDAGIDRAVVFGLPVKKRWPWNEPKAPTYYLDDSAGCYYYSLTDALVADRLRSLPDADRKRLAPLVCGFDPTDQLAIEQVERVWTMDIEWAGIGELLLRHDDLTNVTQGETPSIGHPALDPIFDFARQHDVPVSVHHDASSVGRPGDNDYVPDLDEALGRHPRTDIVWCHAGISRSIEPDGHARLVGDLLDKHPRLHIDLSWRLADIVVPDGDAAEDWVRLVAHHPDRFVVGSDVVGAPDAMGSSWNQFAPLLARLDSSAAELVSATNAARLWF